MTDFKRIRGASLRQMASAGVPAHPNLPLLEEHPMRSAEDVARRVVALYCLAGLANGANGPAMLEWITEECLEACFEGSELDVLAAGDPTEQKLNELSWCQESLFLLAWALSKVDEVSWPSEQCDLTPVFPNVPPEIDAGVFVKAAQLRPEEELLQAADLYYCLDASLRHDELWGGQPTEQRYPMVQIVMERRRAIDWIMSDCAWQEVSLDT